MDRIYVGRCADCKRVCQVEKSQTWIDYKSSSDVRVGKCPFCGEIVILEYIEQPDRESWYYEYGR